MADYASIFDNNPKMIAYIPDGVGTGSWPITGYTYLILHTTSMTDCNKAQAIVDFIKWAQSDPTAQKAATTLGYSVLPDAVRAKVLAALGQVTCGGQPVK
jgi:ABC-type phosphate transport system substrate-binding protein